ncbi:MAG: protein-(glutamine-N5) methyltransferase, release factor-specific [Ignavibacteriales bacterium CG18_big_fil_WC_8_21_14_2_50_31_20]|nr:MAG: protein-(glutamine-N5) methyltransferase, release factor-specific [Ignavibacteriales bacterium CG18_big_fil_WC_8_21_14_2_50_31_20]
MLTVLESLKLSTTFLENKGIESARMNAELLLSHILECKRLDLYLRFDQPLKPNETNIYREYISRRGNFEPFQYIVGEVEFYGLKFFVDKNVLIPRQETEILIETILENTSKTNELKILDIGSGSGNIPISLAVNLPLSKVISIDISAEAISVAEKNRELHDLKSRIGFIKADILINNLEKYNNTLDIIVSNPPYVNKDEFSTLQKEILNFEPEIAVTDFSDGLTFYKVISEKSKSLLKENGMLFFEVGQGQAEDVQSIMMKNGFKNIEIIKDLDRIERVVVGTNK